MATENPVQTAGVVVFVRLCVASRRAGPSPGEERFVFQCVDRERSHAPINVRTRRVCQRPVRSKGDKFAPFDRGDFGLWLGGLLAVVPSHHKCKPTTPGAKSARPEGWLHIGSSAALRRLPDAPHRAARRALPSGADLQPSNGPNLSPFDLGREPTGVGAVVIDVAIVDLGDRQHHHHVRRAEGAVHNGTVADHGAEPQVAFDQRRQA